MCIICTGFPKKGMLESKGPNHVHNTIKSIFFFFLKPLKIHNSHNDYFAIFNRVKFTSDLFKPAYTKY